MADRDTPQADVDVELLKAVENTAPEPDPVADPDPAPVRQSESAVPAQPPAAARRGGSGSFFAALLGGVLAAGGGFALARYLPQTATAPVDLSAIEQQLAAQSAENQALKAELERLAGSMAEAPVATPDPDLIARVQALEVATPDAAPDLTPLTERIATLEARLGAIETMPADGTGASPAAVAALAQQITAMQAEVAKAQGSDSALMADVQKLAAEAEARLQEAGTQAEALKAAVEAEGQAALARAAIARVRAALDAGVPFADALADLGSTAPDALTAVADGSIATLAQLQQGFPAAARDALQAAIQSDMGDTWTERATSFLRAQTGVRSLDPREGTGPDAVLSRAEAALADGLVDQALTELAALPPAGTEKMAPWIAEAQRRLAAEAAVAELAAQLSSAQGG
jgi:hypothetical protein